VHKGSQRAQREHKVSTKTKPKPYHSQPNQLIERGSQTTCNRKLNYHDSCTLCNGQWRVPTRSDFITRRWLENLIFAILHTSFSVWLRAHYMPLQRSTTGVCHALLRIPQQRAPLTPCGLGRSQSMSQNMSHVWDKVWCQSPLNRARHTTHSIPN
jgi:hypothetical protein